MKEVLLVLGFVLGIFEFQAMSAELQNPAEQRLNPASSLNKMNPDLGNLNYIFRSEEFSEDSWFDTIVSCLYR